LPELCGGPVAAALEQADQGCPRLHLQVYRTDGEVSHIECANLAIPATQATCNSLFRDKLDRIDPGFGLILSRL